MTRSHPTPATGIVGDATRAAAAPTGVQRRHPADDLERARDDLDALIARVRAGARSTQHFDELETEAHRIGRAIVAAFRRPSRSQAAPLYVSADGRKAIW